MKCEASKNDVYSRRRYEPCGKEASLIVTLYGVPLWDGSPEAGTPMCSECAERTKRRWLQTLATDVGREMRVAIGLMGMDSDPGYVRSSGYQEAILVKAKEAAICGSDPDALWRLEGVSLHEQDLTDVEHRSSRRGALNYSWTTGVYAVPEGFVVVQRISEDICTNDEPFDNAWVVNEESLLPLYQERAAAYRDLIQRFSAKKASFHELKNIVK